MAAKLDIEPSDYVAEIGKQERLQRIILGKCVLALSTDLGVAICSDTQSVFCE